MISTRRLNDWVFAQVGIQRNRVKVHATRVTETGEHDYNKTTKLHHVRVRKRGVFSDAEYVNCLAHELTHAKQEELGWLKHSHDGGRMWKGELIDFMIIVQASFVYDVYRDLPWEKHAWYQAALIEERFNSEFEQKELYI
jgi:hypothetical protein